MRSQALRCCVSCKSGNGGKTEQLWLANCVEVRKEAVPGHVIGPPSLGGEGRRRHKVFGFVCLLTVHNSSEGDDYVSHFTAEEMAQVAQDLVIVSSQARV